MPEATEVTIPSEFMRLLEESGILRHDELLVARGMLRQTPTSRMLARRLVAKGLLTRWQAGQLLVGWTRLRLGNYKLCRQIGRGGFGRVFLAEHIQLHREVAIKTLSRRYTQRTEFVEQFLDEARRAAALDHRNLVHVLDIDAADDQYYMVMEYVVGQDLQHLVQFNGPLTPSLAANCLRQAADGLQYAHQAGLVHQDVCPANLMLDEKGGIKLLGLGVGSLMGSSDASSKTDNEEAPELLDEFRSPEQLSGETQGDARGDIFSLGATAAYLLTGKPLRGDSETGPPVPGPSGDATKSGDTSWPPAGLDLPRPLVKIIQKMLAVDPERRYPTARAAGAALQEWLNEHVEQSPSAATHAGAVHPSVPPPAPRELDATTDALEESTARSVSDESAGGARRLRGRVLTVAALATLLLATLLLAAAIHVIWPEPSSEVAVGPRPGSKRKTAVSKPVRVLEPRRAKSKSTASKTTLPAAGAGHAQPDMPQDDRDTEVPGASATEDPTAAKVPAGKEDSQSPKVKPKTPSDPPEVKVSESKKPSRPQTVIAEDPLQALPAAIDLPALDQTDAVGPPPFLDVAPWDVSVARGTELSLLGGEHANKTGRFVLRADDRTAPSWTVWLEAEGAGDGGQLAVAELAVHSEQLRFSWKAGASQHVLAPGLCNCVVRFAVGKHVHDMRLRTALLVKPLSVNLQRPSFDQRWPVTAFPDPQHIRFTITRLEEPFPNVCNLKPVEPISADDEEVLVQIGSEDLDDHVVLLKLNTQFRNSFRLEGRAFFLVSPKLEPIALQQKKYLEVVNYVTAKQTQDNLNAQQARAALNQFRKDAARKKMAEKNRRQWEKRLEERSQAYAKVLEETSQAYARMEALTKLREAMAEGAAIHFRLFYAADDCEVDLLRTEGP